MIVHPKRISGMFSRCDYTDMETSYKDSEAHLAIKLAIHRKTFEFKLGQIGRLIFATGKLEKSLQLLDSFCGVHRKFNFLRFSRW